MLRGMASLFVAAFMIGAGLLALWIDVRFPGLAPASLSRRLLAALAALAVLQLAPIAVGSAAVAYATLFGLVFPAFVATFLAAAWIIRALGDARRFS
jgi:hypothetical protein